MWLPPRAVMGASGASAGDPPRAFSAAAVEETEEEEAVAEEVERPLAGMRGRVGNMPLEDRSRLEALRPAARPRIPPLLPFRLARLLFCLTHPGPETRRLKKREKKTE